MNIKSSLSLLLTLMAAACSEVEESKNIKGATPTSATVDRVADSSGGMHVKVEYDVPMTANRDIDVVFTGGFKNDVIIVRGNGRELYRGVLTTDDRSGYAGSMNVSRRFHRIDIAVNRCVAQVEVPEGYSYCLVDRENDTMFLQFTNHEPRFR